MSLAVFSQNLGGAIWLAVVQAAFSERFASSLHSSAPDIDPKTITHAGALGFRLVVSEDEVENVVRAYSDGIDITFYIATGMAVATVCACAGMGWKSVKKVVNVEPEAGTVEK
jgi:hypothetical protein